MNLRYITLYIDTDSGFEESFRNYFNLSSRFISNYLTMQVRLLKFHTDGTFKMISVVPSINAINDCKIIGENALNTNILFDKAAYLRMNEIEKYEYCLQLLEGGYKICGKFKLIPLRELINIHNIFRDNGYKNEWIHKKRKFRELGIEIILNCYFTAIDFTLRMVVYDLHSKSEITSGVVIRTLPDEVCFLPLFKDVLIENDEIIITEYADRPKFKFKISDVLKGKFTFETTSNGLIYEPYVD